MQIKVIKTDIAQGSHLYLLKKATKDRFLKWIKK